MLRTCWSHTPTKRPMAGEIVELFYNNPRLVSPSIDVPLASIQEERSDSLELFPKPKNPQFSSSLTAFNDIHTNNSPIIDKYSPIQDTTDPLLVNAHKDGLLEDLKQFGNETECKESFPFLGNYTPPGYVVLDHTAQGGEYCNISGGSFL